MKSDVMPSRVQMEAGMLKNLLSEVKETVAKDIKLPEPATKPSFGVVDLWKIRRNAKSAIGMNKKKKIIYLTSLIRWSQVIIG